mmetsp:Transcript_12114/g.36007  ORF Transcript_12114/g.36007 Transcript_12114/m.36007 type:complete len:238 (-) Transcript_12114:71-784(-)
MEIQSASAPCKRPEAIDTLLASPAVYEPAAIEPLEAYVRSQAANGTYDAQANQALAKLYQFTPARCQGDILALLLAKALLARPACDVAALLYVVPDALVARDKASATLAKCDALLEASKYREFWAAARDASSGAPVTGLLPGFEAAMRGHLLGLLSQTFTSAPLELVAEVLGCEAAAAAALCAKPPAGAPIDGAKDGMALFTKNADNSKRVCAAGRAIDPGSLLELMQGPGAFGIRQ